MSIKLNQYSFLFTAIEASITAGNEILNIYIQQNFNITAKLDKSPLTDADLKSHHIIRSLLSTIGLPVLSEEDRNSEYNKRKGWNYFWLVDPLDGTKEFIKQNGEFTVNISLIENRKPVLGVIYVPVTGELYYASDKLGSFKTVINNKSKIEDLFKSSQKLPYKHKNDIYTLVVSRSHMNKETEAFINKIKKAKGKIDTISRGSSMKICMIAEGKADCYPRFAPTMEWDTAAGHAIAKYAGKSVKSVETGEELVYNKKDLRNPGFIVE